MSNKVKLVQTIGTNSAYFQFRFKGKSINPYSVSFYDNVLCACFLNRIYQLNPKPLNASNGRDLFLFTLSPFFSSLRIAASLEGIYLVCTPSKRVQRGISKLAGNSCARGNIVLLSAADYHLPPPKNYCILLHSIWNEAPKNFGLLKRNGSYKMVETHDKLTHSFRTGNVCIATSTHSRVDSLRTKAVNLHLLIASQSVIFRSWQFNYNSP